MGGEEAAQVTKKPTLAVLLVSYLWGPVALWITREPLSSSVALEVLAGTVGTASRLMVIAKTAGNSQEVFLDAPGFAFQFAVFWLDSFLL